MVIGRVPPRNQQTPKSFEESKTAELSTPPVIEAPIPPADNLKKSLESFAPPPPPVKAKKSTKVLYHADSTGKIAKQVLSEKESAEKKAPQKIKFWSSAKEKQAYKIEVKSKIVYENSYTSGNKFSESKYSGDKLIFINGILRDKKGKSIVCRHHSSLLAEEGSRKQLKQQHGLATSDALERSDKKVLIDDESKVPGTAKEFLSESLADGSKNYKNAFQKICFSLEKPGDKSFKIPSLEEELLTIIMTMKPGEVQKLTIHTPSIPDKQFGGIAGHLMELDIKLVYENVLSPSGIWEKKLIVKLSFMDPNFKFNTSKKIIDDLTIKFGYDSLINGTGISDVVFTDLRDVLKLYFHMDKGIGQLWRKTATLYSEDMESSRSEMTPIPETLTSELLDTLSIDELLDLITFIGFFEPLIQSKLTLLINQKMLESISDSNFFKLNQNIDKLITALIFIEKKDVEIFLNKFYSSDILSNEKKLLFTAKLSNLNSKNTLNTLNLILNIIKSKEEFRHYIESTSSIIFNNLYEMLNNISEKILPEDIQEIKMKKSIENIAFLLSLEKGSINDIIDFCQKFVENKNIMLKFKKIFFKEISILVKNPKILKLCEETILTIDFESYAKLSEDELVAVIKNANCENREELQKLNNIFTYLFSKPQNENFIRNLTLAFLQNKTNETMAKRDYLIGLKELSRNQGIPIDFDDYIDMIESFKKEYPEFDPFFSDEE